MNVSSKKRNLGDRKRMQATVETLQSLKEEEQRIGPLLVELCPYIQHVRLAQDNVVETNMVSGLGKPESYIVSDIA